MRNIDPNLIQIIRQMQEDIKLLKSNNGSSRLNSIRLGNWVLETVDDSLVKMTNLTTGIESFIGGVGDGGGGDVYQTVTFEFPPFTVAGVVRTAFNISIKTNVYTVPYDVTSTKIIATLASTGYPGDPGVVFSIVHNGVVVFTSPAQTTNKEIYTFNHDFGADDEVYMTVDSSGTAIGLTVMIRSV